MDQQQQVNTSPVVPSSNNRVNKVLIAVIVILAVIATVFVFMWYREYQKVKLMGQAVTELRQITDNIDTMYEQFQRVDENAHGQAIRACMQIEESKPEYQKLKQQGVCDPHSNVFKPDYSSFTPAINENISSLNSILEKLGFEKVRDFDDRPAENYIKQTGQDAFYSL